MGLSYEQGLGLPQCYKEAAVWYKRQLTKGLPARTSSSESCTRKVKGFPKATRKLWCGIERQAAKGSRRTVKTGLHKPTRGSEVLGRARGRSVACSDGTRGCAYCGAREANGGGALKPFARCKRAAYCRGELQKGHWKALGGHTSSCLPAFSN